MSESRRQFRKTIESYFDIEVADGDPILDEFEETHLSGGDWLIQQGEMGDALYLLVRGRLLAWTGVHGEGAGEARTFLGEIVPGDSVGEVSLLTDAPRSASIQAIRDSLLVKIDRAAFERLAQNHPALVLKLAGNVASVLHKSTTGQQSSKRSFNTIALLPVEDCPRTEAFCRNLCNLLAASGSCLFLSPDELRQVGAPSNLDTPDATISHELRHWINDQEINHRFVVFLCSANNSPWSRFAQRQSDVVLTVADASADTAPRPWEQALAGDEHSSIGMRILVLLQGSDGDAITGTQEWQAPRRADFHLHVRDGVDDDIRRVARFVTGEATGLVLAGGAARGLAHLGIYKALKELDIPIDWVGGTSIGAIMGSVVSLDWTSDRAIHLGREAFVKGKPFGDFTAPMMSLIRGRRMETLLNEHVPFQIEDLPIPFFCVSCNLDAGTLNLHETGYLPDALRASAALPGILPPAVVDQQLTIDGAVINNMPVDIMKQKPVSQVIAVNLASQKRYQVEYKSMPSPWAVLRGRYLPFTKRHRVPGLSTLLLKATELGTMTRVREQGRMADVLLNPPVRNFGMTEVKSYDQIVEAGYRHAMEELEAWKQDRSS